MVEIDIAVGLIFGFGLLGIVIEPWTKLSSFRGFVSSPSMPHLSCGVVHRAFAALPGNCLSVS